jgi:hypothetical protein
MYIHVVYIFGDVVVIGRDRSSTTYAINTYPHHNIGVLTIHIEFMWRGLETGEKMSFSESFHPFRAEPHKFYIYRQYTNIVIIMQYNLQHLCQT